MIICFFVCVSKIHMGSAYIAKIRAPPFPRRGSLGGKDETLTACHGPARRGGARRHQVSLCLPALPLGFVYPGRWNPGGGEQRDVASGTVAVSARPQVDTCRPASRCSAGGASLFSEGFDRPVYPCWVQWLRGESPEQRVHTMQDVQLSNETCRNGKNFILFLIKSHFLVEARQFLWMIGWVWQQDHKPAVLWQRI